MAYEAVDVFVTDATLAQNPVSGVLVKVFSSNGFIVYGQQSTDADGKASFLLPSEFPYQLRAYKFGYSFDQPLLFEVWPSPLQPGQTNSFYVEAASITPPVPNDARLCTAYGYFRDITGAPRAGLEMRFTARFAPAILDGSGVIPESVTARTDEKGYAQINLIRNGQYSCMITGSSEVSRRIDVPDTPNVNLPDLIFPVVERVIAIPEGPYTLAVNEELSVELHVMTTDRNDLGLRTGDVSYRSSNGEVLGFTFDATHIILRGNAPGTAQVDITRAEQSIVRIPDPGLLGQPLLVTVTP